MTRWRFLFIEDKMVNNGILLKKEKYRKDLLSLRYWLLGKECYRSLQAMEFALRYHTGTRKDNETPEFQHQLGIAHYIRTLMPHVSQSEDTFTTVFLHDIAEDYDVSTDTLRRMFTDNVSHAVWLLTKKYSGGKKDLTHYYEAMIESPIASLVKGADRVHNIQTSPMIFTVENQKWYVEETEKYILPMLKAARRRFPEQEMAYENIKHLLNSQIELIKEIQVAREKK